MAMDAKDELVHMVSTCKIDFIVIMLTNQLHSPHQAEGPLSLLPIGYLDVIRDTSDNRISLFKKLVYG